MSTSLTRREFLQAAGTGAAALVFAAATGKLVEPSPAEASAESDLSPETPPPMISEEMRANMTPTKNMLVAYWLTIFSETTNGNVRTTDSPSSEGAESPQDLPNKLECCIQLDDDDYLLVYKMSDNSFRAIVYSSSSKRGQFLDWTQQNLNTVFSNLATDSDGRTPMARFDAEHNLFVMVKRDTGNTGIYSYDTNGDLVDFKVTAADTAHFLHGVDVYGDAIYSSGSRNSVPGYSSSQLYVSDASSFQNEVLVQSGNLPNVTKVAVADRGQMAVQFAETPNSGSVRKVRFFKRSGDTYIPDSSLPEITLNNSENLVPSGNYPATYSFEPNRQLLVKTRILPPHDRTFNYSGGVQADVTDIEVLSAMIRPSSFASGNGINVRECIITAIETDSQNINRLCIYSVKSDENGNNEELERKVWSNNVVDNKLTQNLPGNVGLISGVDVMFPRRFKALLPTIQRTR